MFHPASFSTSDVLASAPSNSGPRTVGTSRPQVEWLAARCHTSRNSAGTWERGTAGLRHGAAGTPAAVVAVVEVTTPTGLDVTVLEGPVETGDDEDEDTPGPVVDVPAAVS